MELEPSISGQDLEPNITFSECNLSRVYPASYGQFLPAIYEGTFYSLQDPEVGENVLIDETKFFEMLKHQ